MSSTPIGVGSHGPSFQKGQPYNFSHAMPIIVEDTQVERLDGFITPTGGVVGDGPYEFNVPAVNDAYLMLGNLSLYMKAKVVKGNGEVIDNGTANKVAPVNCLGTTLWQHVEVLLNDYVINSGSSTNAHYKGYLETMLSYDVSSRVSHLRAQIFSEDTPGKFDTMVGGDRENKGWGERQKIVKGSESFDFMAPITADFLRSDKHLAPGNKLTIKLYKARNEFILNTTDNNADYKLVIQDLKLYYERIRLKENIAPPSVERYLFNRTELKRYPLPDNMTRYHINLHQGGKMPKQIIIAQVLTSAAEGEYNENPFFFQHFNLNHLCLKVNGQRVPSLAI